MINFYGKSMINFIGLKRLASQFMSLDVAEV